LREEAEVHDRSGLAGSGFETVWAVELAYVEKEDWAVDRDLARERWQPTRQLQKEDKPPE
jgi:hypothetical protein